MAGGPGAESTRIGGEGWRGACAGGPAGAGADGSQAYHLEATGRGSQSDGGRAGGREPGEGEDEEGEEMRQVIMIVLALAFSSTWVFAQDPYSC